MFQFQISRLKPKLVTNDSGQAQNVKALPQSRVPKSLPFKSPVFTLLHRFLGVQRQDDTLSFGTLTY